MTTMNRIRKTGKGLPASRVQLILSDVQLWVPLAVLAAGLVILAYVR